jgi:hypothetical protein
MKRRSSLRIKSGMGTMLLAVWLILSGLTVFVPAVRGLNEFFPILALGAGVLLLLNR